jgi:hypothetical protein
MVGARLKANANFAAAGCALRYEIFVRNEEESGPGTKVLPPRATKKRKDHMQIIGDRGSRSRERALIFFLMAKEKMHQSRPPQMQSRSLGAVTGQRKKAICAERRITLQ